MTATVVPERSPEDGAMLAYAMALLGACWAHQTKPAFALFFVVVVVVVVVLEGGRGVEERNAGEKDERRRGGKEVQKKNEKPKKQQQKNAYRRARRSGRGSWRWPSSAPSCSWTAGPSPGRRCTWRWCWRPCPRWRRWRCSCFFFSFFFGFCKCEWEKKKKRGEGRMEILSAPNAARREPSKTKRSPPPPQKKKKKTTATHAKPRVARAICAAPLNLVAGVAVVTQLVMALPARSHLYAPPTP